MDNRSREELIMWLTQIIDRELNKSDDQTDMDLILECSDYLDELQKEKNFYKEQDILQKIAIIKQRVENSAKNEESVRIIRTKRRVPLYKKILIAVAAALLIAISTLAVVAHVQNYESMWDFIEKHIDQIRHTARNSKFEQDSITVTITDTIVWYSCIEELLMEENSRILYPQMTSDSDTSDEVISIYKSDLGNGDYRIVIYCIDSAKQILILNRYTVDYSNLVAPDIYTCNGRDFYLFEKSNLYQASCQYNGYEYTIISDTRDSLIEIIQNLKEYKP